MIAEPSSFDRFLSTEVVYCTYSITEKILCQLFEAKNTENFLFIFRAGFAGLKKENPMLDLQKLFAEKVLANITATKDQRGMTDIALIDALVEMGAFTDGNRPENLEKVKEAKRNMYNDWRSGKSKSYLKIIEEIAEILNTTVEALTGITIIQNAGNVLTNSINESANAVLFINDGAENVLSKQEIELIATYRRLSIKKQAAMIQYLVELSEGE